MTKARFILLSIFAALTVGAVVDPSAPAAQCSAKMGSWCIGLLLAGTLTLTTPVEVLASAVTAQRLSIPTISTTYVCTSAAVGIGNEVVEVENESILAHNVVVILEGCSAEGEASCKVSSEGSPAGTIKTLPLDADLTLVNAKPQWKALPESGTFMTLLVAGCLKAAKFSVSGSQNCNAFDAEETIAEHHLECLATGSELKDGTKEMKYEGSVLVDLAGANEGDSGALKEEFF